MQFDQNSKPPRFEVDRIYFSMSLIKAIIPIKFKCRFFVQIKTFSTTSNIKILTQSKDHYRTLNSAIDFNNQILNFDAYLVYDNQINSYKKKEIQIIVNLISDSRGDETKLVGRIKLDLADFMIQNMAQTILREHELQNCSVKKPEVAKLQYELKMLKQQKLNIQSSSEKDSIFAQIQKSQFLDSTEYNQFCRQVYGNDQLNGSPLNASGIAGKVNKSLVQNEKIMKNSDKNAKNIKSSSKQKQELKRPVQKAKPSILQKAKPSIVQLQQKVKPIKIEQIQQNNCNKLSSIEESEKPSSPKKVVSPRHAQSTLNRAIRESPPKRTILTSPTKQIPKSPQKSLIKRQSSKLPEQSLQKDEQALKQVQNYLTESMFDEQQLVIQSLEQQLQQANDIIDQYKLQFDLLKEENQKLQLQKEAHHLEQQLKKRQHQRAEKQDAQRERQNTERKRLSYEKSQQLQQPQQKYEQIQADPSQNPQIDQINRLTLTLEEYIKVVDEKQEIIRSKDNLVSNLQADLQSTSILYEQKLIEKDQIHQQLVYDYQLIQQINAELQARIAASQKQLAHKQQWITQQQLQAKNKQQEILRIQQQKQKERQRKQQEMQHETQRQQNLNHQIQQLKLQIETMAEKDKQSVVNQLKSQVLVKQSLLQNKQNQIKELEEMVEMQKATSAQFQLRIADLQHRLSQSISQIQSLNKEISKKQAILEKFHAVKETAQQEMQKAVEKSKSIQKQKYFLTEQINTLNLQSKGVSKQVEQRVSQYKKQLSQMQQAYEQSQNKIAELKFAVQSYQSTLEEQQCKNLRQVEQLTRKLENFNKKQHLLRQSLDMLENQTNKIRIYVQEKENKILNYEQKIMGMESQIIQNMDRINFLERKYKIAQSTIEEQKIELKIIHAMAPREQTYGSSAQGNHQEQLQARLFILNQANSQLLQKQKVHTQTVLQKDNQINELYRKIAAIDPIRRQNSSLSEKLSLQESINSELSEHLKNMTKTDSQMKLNLQRVTAELQNVYQQCQKFEEEIKSLQEEKFVVFSANSLNEIEVSRLRDSEERLKKQLLFYEKQKKDLSNAVQKNQNYTNQLIEKITLLETNKTNLQQKLSIALINKTQKKTFSAQINNQNLSGFTQNSSPPRLLKIQSKIKLKKYEEEREPIEERRDIRASSHHSRRSKEQEEVYSLREQLQGYKQREQQYMCNVLDLQMQLDKIKEEKNTLSQSINEQRSSMKRNISINVMGKPEQKQLKSACDQLEKLIELRIKNREPQSLIQMLISNSDVFASSSSRITTEQGSLAAQQKNSLQQKSRILSRQVQKIKSLILKKAELSMKDKSQMIQILKPCEKITNQLIKIVQNFAREQEQQTGGDI